MHNTKNVDVRKVGVKISRRGRAEQHYTFQVRAGRLLEKAHKVRDIFFCFHKFIRSLRLPATACAAASRTASAKTSKPAATTKAASASPRTSAAAAASHVGQKHHRENIPEKANTKYPEYERK